MAFLMVIKWSFRLIRAMYKRLFFSSVLLCCLLPLAYGQKLILQGSFAIPRAVAATQDVQGNIYLATQQGQVLQYNSKGKPLGTFRPDELLSINSIQALPGLQLLVFDRSNQQIHWIDRFLTHAGNYRLDQEGNAGFIDAVTQAEGNGLWLVDGSQQRLLKRQFPQGDQVQSVALNLATRSAEKLKISYLQEYKGKLYLYSPAAGFLVFDTMGNYEQSLELPGLKNLWMYDGSFYFMDKNLLCSIDLQTNALTKIPVLETNVEHILVKERNIWLLTPDTAYHYLMMAASTEAVPIKN